MVKETNQLIDNKGMKLKTGQQKAKDDQKLKSEMIGMFYQNKKKPQATKTLPRGTDAVEEEKLPGSKDLSEISI